MSLKGVYTALSGAIAQSTKMDTIANNMANVNTPGFKRDQQVFQEYVTAHEKEPPVSPIPRDVASIESFYDMQGGDKAYVDAKGTFTDFSQGSLKPTGNKFDVAIDGKGFFEVMAPGGVRLTRAGNFTLDGNGQLVTKDGYPVLLSGEQDADPAARTINMNGGAELAIADNGNVSVDGNVIGQMSILNVANPDSLMKQGQNLYQFRPNMAPEITTNQNPSLRQGYVEASNINIVQEMTDMIQTQRIFESTQKAISAYDSMTDKAVNVVGKTN